VKTKSHSESKACIVYGCGNQFSDTDHALESAIMELLSRRSSGKTICPSEAARLVDPVRWEQLMEPSRAAAERLVAQGLIVITQQGIRVDPSRAKGAIRLRLA
jgi:hypothetical protein